eukprot:8113077-Pyramimonas_sp.AAC.1
MVNMMCVGLKLVTHNLDWEMKSGVATKSGIARKRKHLSSVLSAAQSVDQYDLTNSPSKETHIRRLIQIEAAGRRNPMSPDFEGLGV